MQSLLESESSYKELLESTPISRVPLPLHTHRKSPPKISATSKSLLLRHLITRALLRRSKYRPRARRILCQSLTIHSLATRGIRSASHRITQRITRSSPRGSQKRDHPYLTLGTGPKDLEQAQIAVSGSPVNLQTNFSSSRLVETVVLGVIE